MSRPRIPPPVPGAESDHAVLQAGASASASAPSGRVVNDAMFGAIDLDRMESVMNAEIDAMRASGVASLDRQMIIDHFTRNSPQAVLSFMGDRLTPEALQRFVDAVRKVMYEPGQTVVPMGYVIQIVEGRSVRLVPMS